MTIYKNRLYKFAKYYINLRYINFVVINHYNTTYFILSKGNIENEFIMDNLTCWKYCAVFV